jgi:8-oxo-dGTP pyrophosphatase MutT (NUDIX family)
MLFEYIIGIQDFDSNLMKIISRQAIRAVIVNENKLLLVRNNKGDYKFPGGGSEKAESYEDTLIREVREETGYLVNSVKEEIGQIIERSLDKYEDNTIFQNVSHYYICLIKEGRLDQKLDIYEEELGFSPELIEVDKAIHINEKILESNNDINPWVYRETKALKEIKEYIKSSS